MSKQAFCNLCTNTVAVRGVDASRHGFFVPTCGIHSGQPHLAPRSFFGVEDYLDDDNNPPYTYQKGKKSKNPNKHVSFKQGTLAYMEPFTLDVFVSKRFVFNFTHSQGCMQAGRCCGYQSKDIKAVLKSRLDISAYLAVGWILADQAREADVYNLPILQERGTSLKEKAE